MAEEEEWRVTTTLESADDAARLHAELTKAGAAAIIEGASVSLVGAHLYAYGSSRAATEAIVAAIRDALHSLAVVPTSVAVDMWLPDRAKWGDPDRDDGDEDDGPPEKQSWISTLMEGLSPPI